MEILLSPFPGEKNGNSMWLNDIFFFQCHLRVWNEISSPQIQSVMKCVMSDWMLMVKVLKLENDSSFFK